MGNKDLAHVGFARWFVWHTLRMVWTPLAAVVFRPQVSGVEGLPDTGYLLLANHTGAIDTIWVAAPTGRVLHFMTSAARFRSPVMGRMLTFFNCFPKTVGARDASATQAVRDLLEAGQVVQIMPEGMRTWDGRLNPIRPSIGALVQSTGATVVLCRVQTGHLFWPRWASFPRWVPLVIEYGAPLTWSAETDPDDVWRTVVQGLTLEPRPIRGRTLKRKLAEGLPTYLWACPVCFERTPTASGDTLRCAACERTWTLTLDLELQGEPALSVADAWDRIEAHYGSPPRLSPTCVLEGEVTMSAFDTGAPLFQGLLRLTDTGLAGPDGWTLGYDEVKNAYLDAGNVLVLRLRDRPQLKLAPVGQSTWMWFHFVTGHLDHHRAHPEEPR